MFFDSLKRSIREMKESTLKMFNDLEKDFDNLYLDPVELPKGTIMEETVEETKHADGSVTKVTKRTYKGTKEG
jgi:hypothetical protein